MLENNTCPTIPEVTLGEYKGLKVKKTVNPVTDDAIENELKKILNQNAKTTEITGRPIETGDVATIDFEGFVGDVAFEGGKGEQVDLEIGSQTFIPGFEEQLVGKNPGEAFDILVNFPEGYGGPELSGKEARFQITVHKISAKSIPEATDDFAREVAGVQGMTEFRALLREKLEESANFAAEQIALNDLMAQIIESSTFTLSDGLVESETSAMLQECRQQLQGRGVTLENYLEMMGQSMDQFLSGIKEPATMRAKSTMAIKAIAGLEGVAVTDDDMVKEYEQISKIYGIPLDELKARFKEDDLSYIKAVVMNKKVMDLLIKESVIEQA